MFDLKAVKIITIVCWLITALAIAGLAIWFMTGTLFGQRAGTRSVDWNFSGLNIGALERLTGPYEVDGVYNVETAGINSLNIDWVAGGITVKPHDGNEIRITEYAQRALANDEKLHYTISGGTLTVKYREHNVGISLSVLNKRLEVLVPRELCENLNRFSVDSISGGIDVSDVNAVAFTVSTTSGGANLSGIVSQTFSADTMSGSITVTSVGTYDMNIDSTSGSVTVARVQANNMSFNGMSGSVRISDSSADTLDIDTTSGSINASGDFNNVKLSSMSGRLSLDNSAPRSVLNADTTSGSLQFSGSFDRVNIDSMSGSLTIRSAIVPSHLKADTTSGDINIYVPNEGAVSVHHSSTSGRFSSDIPVTIQNRDAQFVLSSMSGNARIFVMN